MQTIYTETAFISAGEANPEQELSLAVLVAKLIDIATAHANSLGIGNPSMTELKAGWVLSRLTVDMQSYPKVNDTYCISTWVVSFNRHFSERDFCISSPDGKIYGYARSIWMVISTEDHSNLGLSHLTLSPEIIAGNEAPIDKQAKHGLILPPEAIKDSHKGVLPATHPVFEYQFKYSDLDSYRHVNTVRYVVILLNQFSLSTFDKSYVRRLELSFMHEARYGMEIELWRHEPEPGHASFLIKEKDFPEIEGKPLFYARIMLESRKDNDAPQ